MSADFGGHRPPLQIAAREDARPTILTDGHQDLTTKTQMLGAAMPQLKHSTFNSQHSTRLGHGWRGCGGYWTRCHICSMEGLLPMPIS